MKKISIRDFFQTSDYSHYAISPDGTYLSFFKKINNRSNIVIKNITTLKEVQLTDFRDRSIATYGWIDNEHIWFLKDIGGDEDHHLYIINLISNITEEITPWEKVKVANVETFVEEVFYENKEQFKDLIRVSHNKRTSTFFDSYNYNIKTKQWSMYLENNDNIIDVLENKEDKIIYKLIEQAGKSIVEVVDNDGKWNSIKEISSKDVFEFFNYNPDKTILIKTNIGVDKIGLYKYQLDLSEQTRELIFADDTVDIGSVFINTRKNDKIIAIATYKDYLNINWFDEEKKQDFLQAKKTIKQFYPQFENAFFAAVSSTVDKNKTVYVSYSDDMLSEYFLYDKLAKTALILNYTPSVLNPTNLTKMKPISYKSRDGLTIHGYLTMPKNAKGPVPFVVLPHGGPWGRDYWGYDPEVQFLANRGYGVLQMNFRVSTGYGKKFFLAGWHQWGLKIQDDITDATLWAIEQGFALKDKIAIYGASFGGYATLMGIIREPDLYAAAVDYVGVSDLFVLWDNLPDYWKTEGNIFEEALGNPHENVEYAKSVSPSYHVDKIKTPLLIVQGANDPRVPKEQSDIIYESLKNRNIDVEYMVKYDEGHGFANEENRFEMYDTFEKFLEKHLQNK